MIDDRMSVDGRLLRPHRDAPKYSTSCPRLEEFLGVALHPFRQYGGRAEADALGEAWIAEFRSTTKGVRK